MFRRRTRIKVNRPFIKVKTGTGRQRSSRRFLYGIRQAVQENRARRVEDLPIQVESNDAPPIVQDQVSDYYKRKEDEVNDWQATREVIIKSLVNNWVPHNSQCSSCSVNLEDTTFFRCLDCGPHTLYCEFCLVSVHDKHILHMPEMWKYGTFVQYQHVKDVDTGHSSNCGVSLWRIVTVFDDKGRCHNLNIKFCSCEHEVATVVKLRLWPASSKTVKVAFTIELMKWMEILLLECQVSTKGFCEALKLKNDLQPFEVNWLKNLAHKETVYEFREACYQLNKISKTDDVVCSACPKDGGTKFVSIDGNFGLVRRKKAGDSLEPPKHDSRLFMPDEEVQEFVCSYDDSSSGSKDCHRFKAGDKLRSKSRTSKLDITGVLGCVCRHESPVLFMNLQHGERLAYPILLLNKLMDMATANNQKLYVTYDIACVLTAHLKNRQQDEILNKLKMTIPIFHCYGHKASCQVEFSPRRTEHFGLTDGESIERLWSYLRCFSKITKEMTPSHRVDLLTDALLHFARRKEMNIGRMLVQKHKNAESVLKTAEKDYAEKVSALTGIDQNTVQRWINEEKAELCRKLNPDKAPWEERYVDQLVQLDSLKNDSDLSEQYTRLEKANGVTKRWGKKDSKFISAHTAHQRRCKLNFLDKMREVAKERMFLLDLKKKYFDGQAVAIRISRQINKTSVNLRKLLATYKTFDGAEHTTFAEVTNPESNIYLPPCESSKDNIPTTVKREIINVYCLKERASEEILMVEREMMNVITYYMDQHELLYKQIQEENIAYDKRSFLIFNIITYEKKLKGLEDLFSKYITTPTVPSNTDFAVHVDNRNYDEEEESLDDRIQVEEDDNCQYSSDEYSSDDEYGCD